MFRSNINKIEANESIGEGLLGIYAEEISEKNDKSIVESLNKINLNNCSSTKDNTDENQKDKIEESDERKYVISLNIKDVTKNEKCIFEEVEGNKIQGQGLNDIKIDSHDSKSEVNDKTIFGNFSNNKEKELSEQNNIIIEGQALPNNQRQDLTSQKRQKVSEIDKVAPTQNRIIIKEINNVELPLTIRIQGPSDQEKKESNIKDDLPEQKKIIPDEKLNIPKNDKNLPVQGLTKPKNEKKPKQNSEDKDEKKNYIKKYIENKKNYPKKEDFFNSFKKKIRIEDLIPEDSILIQKKIEVGENNHVKYHYQDLLTNQNYIVEAIIDENAN